MSTDNTYTTGITNDQPKPLPLSKEDTIKIEEQDKTKEKLKELNNENSEKQDTFKVNNKVSYRKIVREKGPLDLNDYVYLFCRDVRCLALNLDYNNVFYPTVYKTVHSEQSKNNKLFIQHGEYLWRSFRDLKFHLFNSEKLPELKSTFPYYYGDPYFTNDYLLKDVLTELTDSFGYLMGKIIFDKSSYEEKRYNTVISDIRIQYSYDDLVKNKKELVFLITKKEHVLHEEKSKLFKIKRKKYKEVTTCTDIVFSINTDTNIVELQKRNYGLEPNDTSHRKWYKQTFPVDGSILAIAELIRCCRVHAVNAGCLDNSNSFILSNDNTIFDLRSLEWL